MKWVIDMNLSPDWVPLLAETGDEVMHWCSIGSANAPDRREWPGSIEASTHRRLSWSADFRSLCDSLAAVR